MVSLQPGITPLPIVITYFAAASVAAFVMLKKSKARMKLMDYVVAAIGGAITSFADHVLGHAVYLPTPIYPFVNPPFWFRILVFFITVGLVRKVGAGMLSMAVFDLVGDLTHFGFAGEPLWLIEDVLTYGFMADVAIFLTKGRLFGIGERRYATLYAVFEGGLLGFFMALVHPFFTYGFFAPIIKGFVPSQAYVQFLVISYIPGHVAVGALSAVIAARIARVVRATV